MSGNANDSLLALTAARDSVRGGADEACAGHGGARVLPRIEAVHASTLTRPAEHASGGPRCAQNLRTTDRRATVRSSALLTLPTLTVPQCEARPDVNPCQHVCGPTLQTVTPRRSFPRL